MYKDPDIFLIYDYPELELASPIWHLCSGQAEKFDKPFLSLWTPTR